MEYEEIISRVADSLGLNKGVVDRSYRTYWRVIRQHITSLPLKEDLTDEEFLKLRPNVNIPSIGKLYVTLEDYRKIKNKYNRLKKIKDAENKGNLSNVHLNSDDGREV